MPFITSIATALGTGLSAAAGTAASAVTAATTTAQGAATALSAIGTATSLGGNLMSAQASREAERLREAQMRINAMRERRQTIRSAMQARAAANVAGVSQGASEGSGVAGGFSQVSSDMSQRVGDTNTNEAIGSAMFRANDVASQGRMISEIGKGMNQFSKDLYQSGPAIGRLFGNTFGGTKNPNDLFDSSRWNDYNNVG